MRQLFLLCFLLPLVSAAQFKLNVDWQLSDTQNEQWHQIGQITTVQADLEKYGMIANPYFGDNEERCQWVANKDWKYRCEKFQISAIDAQKDHIDLVFREVDTFADIYFNGTLILSTDNYFRTYRADVKALLETTGNEIEIVFKSPLRTGNELLLSQKHPLPGEAIRAVARKPQYQYGWDWGPKITTMGLGQDVEIHPWNDSRIENLTIETLAIGDSAKLKMTAVVINDAGVDGSWSVAINGNGQVISLGNAVKLSTGTQIINADITIPNPQLWWPNGSGEAFLYDVQFKLNNGRDKWLKSQKLGIRTVEFINDDDASGQRFGFRVNGKDLFMRGADYIPQELIYHVDPNKELALLQKAADVNINMLRIWGGGKYETDRFYERCDSLGLLIWQDFMFACAMYPGDVGFLANVKIEAEEQVARLSKHACIGLWCGNNESSEGWERWGWKSGLSKKEEKAIEDSYNKLFKKLLPSIVAGNDDAAYWESSPLLGRGDQRFKLRGDAHDWGIWHDGYAFDSLTTRVPRFMSEFGFQSFPDPSTMKMFAKPSDWDSTHVGFKNHEKHPRGFRIVSTYMRREYPDVSDFNHWLYLSQLVQRDGIVTGIRAHRQNEPYCMGTLFWQFNDCWPAASWSAVDYYNREKALHRGLVNAYAPIAVWTEIGDSLVVHLSNQTGQKNACKLKIEDIDMSGWKLVIIEVEETDLAEGTSTISFPKPVGSVLRITWECNGKTYTDRVVLNPKNYGEVIDPDYTIVAVEGRFDITITAWGLTRDLRISTTVDGSFSDNYITMLPRESRTLSFYPDTEVDTIPLTFLSLGKVFN